MSKKYYIILLFCLSLIITGCNTFFYPSLFNVRQARREVFVIDSIKKTVQTEILSLQNGCTVLMRDADGETVRLALYLRTPPLYQNPINAGIENVLLSYVQKRLVYKLERAGISISGQPLLRGTPDFSSLTVEVQSDNAEEALRIFCNSLVISGFSFRELQELIIQNGKRFNSMRNDNESNLSYLLETAVFRTTPLFNRFSGNTVSFSSIKPADIVKYYKNKIRADRMLFLITGALDEAGVTEKNFIPVIQHFPVVVDQQPVYETRLQDNLFQHPPRYLEQSKKDMTDIQALFVAPSFSDDDYFAFYLGLMLLHDNFERNVSKETNIEITLEMINTINYGRLAVRTSRGEIRLLLLGFKRALDKQLSSIGSYYYSGDSTTDNERDYRKQKEEKLVYQELDSVLIQYKKIVLDRFDLSRLDSQEKEETLVRIYFLFNRIIDQQLLKERLDQITAEDVIRTTGFYLKNMSWAILSDKETLSGLSSDFFY